MKFHTLTKEGNFNLVISIVLSVSDLENRNDRCCTDTRHLGGERGVTYNIKLSIFLPIMSHTFNYKEKCSNLTELGTLCIRNWPVYS